MFERPIVINFSTSIDACIANGKSLLEDADLLFCFERPGTALAISVLAQEEFAKAFTLSLVHQGILPWVPSVRRALTSHECKHLVGAIMEWLAPPWEEVHERIRNDLHAPPFELLPAEIADAINILRHEKVERFHSGYAAKEHEWTGLARKIAEGLRDRQKQRALYVGLAESGWVSSTPSQVHPDSAQIEIERAKQLLECSEDVRHDRLLSIREFEFMKEILRAVFQGLE